ncbi:MAG: protein translocase subunit SecF [Pseudomonadota bacterium]|nr:protein translocase subunit SecF [Pseudomonadota bacterium]MEC8996363.1 protein translocase subunit SecF [Pseudomonadota bacterium]|tara:strand:- start:2273 stop:3166 length:894 start_codon:yes stop_codon:yes gene_type:complete
MFSIIKKNSKFDFLGFRKGAIFFSSLLIIFSIISFIANGLNWGIDFSNGYIAQLQYQKDVNITELKTNLKNNGVNDSIVQYYGTNKEVIIKLKDSPKFDQVSINNFLIKSLSADNKFKILRLEYVGSQVGSELREKGEWAMLVALLSILIYIGFRFEFLYGIGAIFALLHDVILTLGFFSITQLQFDLSVLSAILAVIGYSLNDTIVVYDRIRENMRLIRKNDFIDILNISVNQTLSRTIITSLTTLFVLFSLLLAGGIAVKFFAIAMIVGVLVGTYSSIFIASTSLYYLGIGSEEK